MSLRSSYYLPPQQLRAENLDSPLGLHTRNPQLSWKLRWNERGAAQATVRVVAAASCSALLNRDYLWDSGELRTDATEITYAGATLTSRQRVYWQVQVLDESNRITQWSEVTFFEMGLLTLEDWNSQATWLGNHGITVPLYRLSFHLDQVREDICTARLYSTGIGYYEPRLNGNKLGTQALAPEYTDYDKRIVYNTFDIEKQLCSGENVLGIILAGGYATRYQYGTPVFRAQLEILYHNGQQQLVDTASGPWLVSPGPWRDCDIFNGEWYDARLEQRGWDAPGFIAHEGIWQEVKPSNPCSSTDAPKGELVGTYAQTVEPPK
ncbi:MAG: hypothetical protein EOP09_19085 [Proteobacteria bacterium]|nr:MAG: hypothetical protein EOP09_19085 [Pseudomonadota bacterium]